MTTIIDYGVGNLFSLVCSFEKIGEKAIVSSDPSDIESADRIVLPGVGAFQDAAEKLRSSDLIPVIEKEIQNGKPLMGICLGMQLLFDRSFEYGEHKGLGLIKGDIVPIEEHVQGLKVPHMGWNALKLQHPEHPLLKYTKDGDCVYFVHSYCAVNCSESTLAVSEYGMDITALAARKNILGCQFHPEKSGETGLKILKAFCKLKEGSLC